MRLHPQRILEKHPGSSSLPAPHSRKPLNLAAQLPNGQKRTQELATQVRSWCPTHSTFMASQSAQPKGDYTATVRHSSIHASSFLLPSLPPPLLFLLFLFPSFPLLPPPSSPSPFPSKKVSCSPDWFQTQYTVKDDDAFLILLPLAPKCWDHRCVSPFLVT